MKTYADTYIFSQYSDYERKMYEFIMEAERINTSSEEFADVLYDFKRRNVGNNLLKIISSKNVIIGINPNKALPKAFKAFVAKDVKENKSAHKAFIDATDCITIKNGQYVCNKLEWLTSYIINAMVCYIYTLSETKLTNNASIIKDGGEIFTKCLSYIIDRMYKISTVSQLKHRVDYAIALYYQINILGKDINKNYDSIEANAIKISNIDIKDTQLVNIMTTEKDFANINTFVQALGRIFNLKDLKTSNVISLWMQAFGTGTVFALEYFPAFSMMLTNTYVGGYIDQQITIEKIAGLPMVSFVKTILQIGASV